MLARGGHLEAQGRFGHTRRERAERVAELGARFEISAEVDEIAVLIGVRQRMKQRRLPSGEQRKDDQDPCKTGSHASSLEPRR